MVVILLGPPGVGKGTQGSRLADERGWARIATGDLLRAARRGGTELGAKAQRFMDAGQLVPDALIVELVREELAALPVDRGVVFDGFPRTVPQADALEAVLDTVGRTVDAVLLLEADDDVLVKRIAGRRSCPRCGKVYNVHFDPPRTQGVCDACGAELVHRPDDEPETVRHRLEVYREQTEPLVGYYEAAGAPLASVSADGPPDEVWDGMREALSGLHTGREGTP